MDTKTTAVSIAICVSCIAAQLTWAQADGHRTITPSDLKWVDAKTLPPGAKIAVIEGPLDQAVDVTARLKLPAHYEIPPHWHPALERATVLSGTFNICMGDKLDRQKTRALPTGSVSLMQPRMSHFGWTDEETVLQLNTVGPWDIIYVNPADDPRKK